MATNLLKTLLSDPPSIHRGSDGELTLWRASLALLQLLERTLQDGFQTLETGAGLSTIVFASRGCHHTAVVPSAGQERRIRDWCAEHDISTERVTFVIERSETALPALAPDPLDFVLIDGAHGFPAPFIDWMYAARRLRIGGTVVVDDVHIWTGAVLRDFMRHEPQWDLFRDSRFDFSAARRVALGEVGEWDLQPYVVRRSACRQSPRRLGRVAGALVDYERGLKTTWGLARFGATGALHRRIRRVASVPSSR